MERARRAGLEPTPRVVVAAVSIARTILAEARAVDADAIVLGTRGLRGLKSMFLGSVSNAVLQQADRPVTVIPSPELAAARSDTPV